MSRLMLVFILGAFLSAGCSLSNRRDGVQNRWRKINLSAFKDGKTREGDVLASLGPPTRIMSLSERTVFYYLLEHDYSVGLNLIVFRNVDTDVRYDRAVFFFDKDGVLEQHSFSREVLETEEEN